MATGKSSADKSATSDPVIIPVKAYGDEMRTILNEALKANKQSNKEAPKKKDDEQALLQNRSEVFLELGSFSPEAVTKHICNQEPHAGLLLHRDEASGLFQYKRWSGGAGSIAGDSSTDEFSEWIMIGQSKALTFRSSRVSEDKEKIARNQTLSISGCLQDKYLADLFDWDIDQKGWTARWVFIRVEADDDPSIQTQRMSRVSPIGSYLSEMLVPYVASIRPKKPDGSPGFINLMFDDNAQSFYDDTWERINNEANELLLKGTEPAYATYMKKGQLRILKFAVLLHIIDSTVGAQEERIEATSEHPFAEIRYNGLKRVDTPISIDTLERAVRLERLVLKEYQAVASDAHIAKYEVEKAVEQSEHRGKKITVFRAIQKVHTINESDLKKKIRSRKLSSKDISKMVLELIRDGCIKQVDMGRKSPELEYVKDMRD